MLCPYCQSDLRASLTKDKDDQEVTYLECFSCGGHWFPPQLANNISLQNAQSIDAVLPRPNLTPQPQPRCPYCQTRLSLIKHDSIPRGVHVWVCPQAHGNFFPKGELLQFKKAQDAKITYHHLWGIPINSIATILLPVFAVIAIAAGLPAIITSLQSTTESRVAASEILNTPVTTQIDSTSTIISFTTKVPTTSSLSLYQDTQLLRQLPVSTSVTSTHQITLVDLQPNTPYTYTITLLTPSGDTQTSPPRSLELILR